MKAMNGGTIVFLKSIDPSPSIAPWEFDVWYFDDHTATDGQSELMSSFFKRSAKTYAVTGDIRVLGHWEANDTFRNFSRPPALIALNVRCPGAFEILERIKAHWVLRKAPVVVLSWRPITTYVRRSARIFEADGLCEFSGDLDEGLEMSEEIFSRACVRVNSPTIYLNGYEDGSSIAAA